MGKRKSNSSKTKQQQPDKNPAATPPDEQPMVDTSLASETLHSPDSEVSLIFVIPQSKNKEQFPQAPEMAAIHDVLGSMKLTLLTWSRTFDSFGEQAKKLSQVGSRVQASHQLKLLKEKLDEHSKTREARIDELRSKFNDPDTPQALVKGIEPQIQEMVKETIQHQIKERVCRQLTAQIPDHLRHEVQHHKRQILQLQTDLHNSEARRHNASLRSALHEPLRPLLRPLPTPAQSPAYAPSPQPSPSTPMPAGPMPTPVTASNPHPPEHLAARSSNDDIRLPQVSPLFPRDLAALLSLDAEQARKLLEEYGLVENASPEDSPNTPIQTSREEDLTKFMAHIGVPVKMVPAPKPSTGPASSGRGGRPLLSLITTSL